MVQTEVKITQFTSITKSKRKEEGDKERPAESVGRVTRGRVPVSLFFFVYSHGVGFADPAIFLFLSSFYSL